MKYIFKDFLRMIKESIPEKVLTSLRTKNTQRTKNTGKKIVQLTITRELAPLLSGAEDVNFKS